MLMLKIEELIYIFDLERLNLVDESIKSIYINSI